MTKERKKINSETQVTGVSRQICNVIVFSIMTGLIPGISEQRAFSQSTNVENKLAQQNSSINRKHTITSTPNNSNDSRLSGKDGVSLKSTDAAISPAYQQPPVCINCGVMDFADVLEPAGGTAAIIYGGIISGVIGSEILRKETHRYPLTDAPVNKETLPSIRHFNGGQANNIMDHSIGITVDDGTQSVIQPPTAPYPY